ncbi:MAG: hypothetical protein KAX51_12170 [Chromatiaceae bacterium]|nr:hypothetical protein [Chromatiaceae bacterium]
MTARSGSALGKRSVDIALPLLIVEEEAYCARPPFVLVRIEQVPAASGEQQVVCRLPKAQRDGRTALSLTPLAFIDHRAALIPLP